MGKITSNQIMQKILEYKTGCFFAVGCSETLPNEICVNCDQMESLISAEQREF